MYQVDAFAERPFGGNPAAVCVLDRWLHDETLLSIAAENNLSETAFLVASEGKSNYELRWFTPLNEVDLCGHATMAAACVALERCEPTGSRQDRLPAGPRAGVARAPHSPAMLPRQAPPKPRLCFLRHSLRCPQRLARARSQPAEHRRHRATWQPIHGRADGPRRH